MHYEFMSKSKEKSQIKLHEFNPVIYPRLLWISVSKTQFEDRFEDVSEFPRNAYAVVDCAYDKINRQGGVMIRFANRNVMNANNITHESIHAALAILDYCDVQPSINNQEPLTYLAGWIASCCEKVKLNKVK
jgi:hypothetical protein